LTGDKEEKWKSYLSLHLRSLSSPSSTTNGSFIERICTELKSSVLCLLKSPTITIHLNSKTSIMVAMSALEYKVKGSYSTATFEDITVHLLPVDEHGTPTPLTEGPFTVTVELPPSPKEQVRKDGRSEAMTVNYT